MSARPAPSHEARTNERDPLSAGGSPDPPPKALKEPDCSIHHAAETHAGPRPWPPWALPILCPPHWHTFPSTS